MTIENTNTNTNTSTETKDINTSYDKWEKYLSCEARLRIPSVMKRPMDPQCISLTIGIPNPKCFPLKGLSVTFESPENDFTTLQTAYENHHNGEASNDMKEISQYMNERGISAFRPWVGEHIQKYHKPNYNEWDYLIQAGGTQSLDAIFRILMDPNEDTVLAEDFTYSCFLETCKPLRARVFGVHITPNGVDTVHMDHLLSNWYHNEETCQYKKPKIFYTMPTGHNPTGITMTDQTRQDLLKVCQKHDLLIVEDDPYYHLQLNEKSPPSLLKYDTDGRVIRIDSFSKVLMPGLRVSVVTCNKLFHQKLMMFNELTIHSAAAPSQLILSMIFKEWKEQGFEKWLSHLQNMYRDRRDHMLKGLDQFIPTNLIEFNRPDFGMFIWFQLKPNAWIKKDALLTDAQWFTYLEDLIYDKALENKVALTKGHWFLVNKDLPLGAFRATYSFADPQETTLAVQRFADAIQYIHNNLYNTN